MTSGDADLRDRETAGTAGRRDGNVIRLGRHVVPGTPGRQPLVMKFEGRIVTGRGAESLAQKQAAAIRDVLDWIASERLLDDSPTDNATGD